MSKSVTRYKGLFVQSPEQWKPHKLQKDAVKWLLEHASGALFADPGVGKTSVTLAALSILFKKKVAKKVLVIAPRRVCHEVWPDEIAKWKDFNHLRVEVIHGPKKDEALARDADIYCVNPEGLEWLFGRDMSPAKQMKRWLKLGFDTLVVDELSKFKHYRTKRFKLIKPFLPTFKRRWGLTGSPAANGLMDLFGEMYMLDDGAALGRYITHFRNTYFTKSYDGFSWDLREGAETEIYNRINPTVMRIDSSHLDLPKLVDRLVKVELDDKSFKTYLELENLLITEMDEGIITAANSAVASAKCRQIASGGIYLSDEIKHKKKNVRKAGDRFWLPIHEAKLDALETLVDELNGKPILVAYEFQHDVEHIKDRFGDLPRIGGGVSDAEAAEISREWKQGKIPVLLGQPSSMAHGLNFQGQCQHVAWFSLTWDYELYDQFIKRVHRQGNKFSRVFVHHIMSKGTIDEAVYGALRSKASGQQALFDALKLLRKERKSLI